MRRYLLIVWMMCAFALLGAISLDEAVDELLGYGSFMDDDGSAVFMCNAYWNEFFPAESDAYDFVAYCAMMFLIVQAEWESLADSGTKGSIDSTDRISCPWEDEYGVYMVSIPMWEIRDNFGDLNYDSIDLDELQDDIGAYVNYYGDIDNLMMD